jgi:hypothetical protein
MAKIVVIHRMESYFRSFILLLLTYGCVYYKMWMASRSLKRLVCLIAFLLLFSNHFYPNDPKTRETKRVAETICVTNVFAVDIEYPNFFVSILAHLAGVNTDSLKFIEWDIRTPFLSSFLLHLTDADEQRWFEIASDSAFPSFVKLPLEDRTALTPSALNFFINALQFLRNKQTDTLYATFEYGHDTLGASVFHLPACTDTRSPETIISHIETWNKRTGEEYNSADVTAITQEGYTTFSNIKVFLKKKEITLQLTSARVTMVRTEY